MISSYENLARAIEVLSKVRMNVLSLAAIQAPSCEDGGSLGAETPGL